MQIVYLNTLMHMVADILHELQEIKNLLQLNKKMLTLDEFCSYSGISKNYAYHLTSTGKVKFYRPFGKMIYFDIDDIVFFLKKNSSETDEALNLKADRYLM